MKHDINWTICSVALLCCLANVAHAQSRGACASFSPAGTWGLTHTGTIIFPSGPVPVAIVGIVTVDANGSISGTQTSSLGGQVIRNTLRGSLTMNPDCTGTFTAQVLDQSGSLQRTVIWESVYVNQTREAFGVATSLTLPNGVSLPAIMAGHGKRISPGLGDGQ